MTEISEDFARAVGHRLPIWATEDAERLLVAKRVGNRLRAEIFRDPEPDGPDDVLYIDKRDAVHLGRAIRRFFGDDPNSDAVPTVPIVSDASFPIDDRVRALSEQASELYLFGFHCLAKFQTDGPIPELQDFDGEAVAELLNVGLWVRDEAGGYRMPELTRYPEPSAEGR